MCITVISISYEGDYIHRSRQRTKHSGTRFSQRYHDIPHLATACASLASFLLKTKVKRLGTFSRELKCRWMDDNIRASETVILGLWWEQGSSGVVLVGFIRVLGNTTTHLSESLGALQE
jgi:hypothetical protein